MHKIWESEKRIQGIDWLRRGDVFQNLVIEKKGSRVVWPCWQLAKACQLYATFCFVGRRETAGIHSEGYGMRKKRKRKEGMERITARCKDTLRQ